MLATKHACSQNNTAFATLTFSTILFAKFFFLGGGGGKQSVLWEMRSEVVLKVPTVSPASLVSVIYSEPSYLIFQFYSANDISVFVYS